MPAIAGYITEEQEQFIQEELVENGPYDDVSAVVEDAVNYYLHNKWRQ